MELRAGIVLILFMVAGAESADLKRMDFEGDAEGGRELAISVCSGCHAVSEDQPFALTDPPDFLTIANWPNVTASSLHRQDRDIAACSAAMSDAEPTAQSRRAGRCDCLHHEHAGALSKQVRRRPEGRAFHPDVQRHIIAEIDKNLTKHPISEIERPSSANKPIWATAAAAPRLTNSKQRRLIGVKDMTVLWGSSAKTFFNLRKGTEHG